MRLALFLTILLTAIGLVMSSKQQADYPSKGEQLVNATLAKTAKVIKNKYDIKPCGMGAAMPGGPIQELTLCFDTKSIHTKEQLRRLLIESAQELLNQINRNNEIQEFLKTRPFTIKNVEIIIYNHDKNGREVYDPGISTAAISQGILTYHTVDPADTFKYKNEFEESYEEALAIDLKDKQDVKRDLRILELLPNLLCPLAVDPSIPADFTALSPKGTLDPYDWIYWGPSNILKAYFENPASLQIPILRVKLSPNIAQTGPNLFNNEELLKMLRKEDPIGFASIETQWGDYPIFAIRTKRDDQLIFMAWVGLNDPEAGWTLMFNLVYPDKEGHPNKEDRQLWESLLLRTTQLTDRDYFKACGQDLQEGYTLVNVNGAKLKMFAEKRERDGMLQVIVIPEGSDIEFQYIDMIECAMGAKWKYGEPIVKVYGEVIVNNKNVKSITGCITSIFFKIVQEFSFKQEDSKKFLIFQKS